jgi:hypothetical protein
MAAAISRRSDGLLVCDISLMDTSNPLPVHAVCTSCGTPVATGAVTLRQDLPLRVTGQWRCGCGATAVIADYYTIFDARTGEEIQMRRPHEQITISVITLAELLRLAQAARAVQEGRPGADERLYRVLAEAPEPIRRLRDRLALGGWTREQKLMLAGVIVALATAMVPLLKDDGSVSEQQLVDVIEQLVEQQSDGPDEQAEAEDRAADSAGESGTGQRGGPSDPSEGGGDGRTPKVKHEKGVGDPDQ